MIRWEDVDALWCKLRAEHVADDAPLPAGRKRWWQRILGQASADDAATALRP